MHLIRRLSIILAGTAVVVATAAPGATAFPVSAAPPGAGTGVLIA